MAKKVEVPEPAEEVVESAEEEVVEEVQEEIPVEEPTEEPVVEEGEIPIIEPPRKKTAQERIDEITRARREAEREREYWKKVALEKEQTPAPVDTPKGPARPTLDQFETTVEYEDALFEWRDRVKSIESAATTERVEQETAVRTFNDRARKLREENDDFDEVIEAPVFSPTMRSVLLQSDNGPEVAYFLGKPENRDQAEKIRNLPASRQAYEIGKLESNLLLAKKTKKVPGAPAPINPVGMGGGGREKDPSEMTTEEWMAWDKQRELDKIKRRLDGG